MVSSEAPPDDFMPFGYTVESDAEPLHDAPEPAPGDPILTELDTKSLSSFFETINANEYNVPSFGEGLTFNASWYDLPPQFMGSSTSTAQQTQNQNASPSSLSSPNQQMNMQRQGAGSQMMPPPPPPQPYAVDRNSQMSYTQQRQQHSEDVLHAAATLLNNGAALRGAHSGNFAATESLMAGSLGQLQHQPMEKFKEDARRTNIGSYTDDDTFLDWMGTAATQPQRGFSRPVPLPEFQWGSDANFTGAQAYVPSENKDTVESQHRQQLTILDCLEPTRSADNTRPSSPQSGKSNTQSKTGLKPPEDPEAPPRKRRKSKVAKTESNADENEEETVEGKSKPARRRKSKAEQSQTSSPPVNSETSGKRRKANGAAAKAQRENLTEEQKRENHIKSEQKRRTLIKEGFDDLCEIIPELSTRGMSKSTMLTMAAEYLENLLHGNQQLSEQLAALQGSQ